PLYRQASVVRDERLARQALDRMLEIDERLGMFAQAVADGRRYLALLRDESDRPRRTEVRVRIGLACEALAQYRLAEKELLGVLRERDPAGARVFRLLALGGLARIAGVIHSPELARRRWREAERAAGEVLTGKAELTPARRAECVWLLAECYSSQARHEEAIV